MDIHKPKPWRGLREFLKEYLIIVVGVLTALAGEQIVESVHRHIEGAALRTDLHEESRQILVDGQRCEGLADYERLWLRNRISQVQAAVWRGQRLAPREANDAPYCASPDVPIWRSAKSAGKMGLLTKGELNAYAEVEYVQTHLDSYHEDTVRAQAEVRAFNNQLPRLPSGEPDFSVLSPDDLRKYLVLLSDAGRAFDQYRGWMGVLIGAEKAVMRGQTNLTEIYASERAASGGDVTHHSM
jgi:hypothetical protein